MSQLLTARYTKPAHALRSGDRVIDFQPSTVCGALKLYPVPTSNAEAPQQLYITAPNTVGGFLTAPATHLYELESQFLCGEINSRSLTVHDELIMGGYKFAVTEVRLLTSVTAIRLAGRLHPIYFQLNEPVMRVIGA